MPDPLSTIAGSTAAGSLGGPAGMAAGLGVGVLGAGLSYLMGSKATDLQRQAGLERARRTNLGNEQALGQATAAAAASGTELSTGSSMALHLSNMASEFRRENDWNVQQVNQGADLSELSNTLGAVTNVGKSLFDYAGANNWWSPKPSAAPAGLPTPKPNPPLSAPQPDVSPWF